MPMDVGGARTAAEREATYRFLDAAIAAEHSRLLEEARGMDAKATVVAGFAAAAISFLLDAAPSVPWWLAVTSYGASFAFALAALWPRRWDGLMPSALRDELSDAAPVIVVGQVAGTRVVVYERNQRRARSKAVLWSISVVFLASGVACSVWSTITEVSS